jgi:hypothetical protein
MHRQQIEVLQQRCKDLDRELAYYRKRLKEECTKAEEFKLFLSEDWYFVKRELYNFITFTRAMTGDQARKSPLLNNIIRFDQKITEFTSIDSSKQQQMVWEDATSSPRSRNKSSSIPVRSGDDVAEDTLQEILNLW